MKKKTTQQSTNKVSSLYTPKKPIKANCGASVRATQASTRAIQKKTIPK